MKPDDLFDRGQEWSDLETFATSPARGLRVGAVSGRRRLGKSFLLRRLARDLGGLYHVALEEESGPALQRFADSLGTQQGLRPGQLRMNDWGEALQAALSSTAPLLILDELPYLLAQPLGATIPSALQALVDASRDHREAAPKRVIVCGSSLSVMSELLSGAKPLRGRADLDLQLRPFDYRTTADFYGIRDPGVAFRLYAVLGGVPGYRDLLAEASPQTDDELDELIRATVGNPSHALFGEPTYLLREDPRITDRALYYSILQAIGAGATTPSKVAAAIGRDVRGLAHPLDVLLSAGFIRRTDDLLLDRRPTLRVADPIVRFHDLVIRPRLTAFEERRSEPAWRDAQSTIRSHVLGPAFEDLAREWVTRYSSPATLGGEPGEVGASVLNDAAGRSQHQLDVVVLAAGQRRRPPRPKVIAIGEAKDSDRGRTADDIARLEKGRDLLAARGVDTTDCKLLLFGRSGFEGDLHQIAERRGDIELIDLERIRSGA